MKLSNKIKAIITLMVIAIISVVGAACGGQKVEFKFTKELPTQVDYGTELYFKDYLPIEYGQNYKLYASYFNVDEQKEVVDEEHDALAFSFDYVSDYKFKIVRNGSDTLECVVKSFPQAPRVIEGKVINQTARETNVQSFERLLIIGYGSLPLENNKEATADPEYEIKATAASFQSVEIDGTDVSSIDISSGSIKIKKQGYYNITYTATNRAGSDSAVLTIRTVDANNHVDTLDGYLLENGEGLDDNQLVFDMDAMPAPADGETIRARFGEGKGTDSAIYDAKYDAYTGKYTIDGFKHELTKDKNERIYLEGADGKLYSTTVTLPTIITQESIDASGSPSQLVNATEGYLLLGSDIDLAAYPFTPNTQFTGVLDGDGHVISNICGPDYVDNYGATRTQGTSLFGGLVNATVKNVTLNGVRAATGMLTSRVEKTLRLKNVIARMNGYTGVRTSLLGYHAESNEFAHIENVIIEMPTMTVGENGSYVGMLTTHAGGKTYVENLVLVGGNGLIHSTAGNNATFVPKHYTNREDSVTGMAEENIDYFVGTNAEVVFDCAQSGNVSDFLLDMAGNIGMVVAIDNNNVDRLQTATSGYFYLTEDIDMAGKTWAPTQGNDNRFTGVINGNGYSINNFTAPEGNAGLVGWTGTNATFKNLNIHAVTNTSKGLLIGQVKGTTYISNLTIEVDEMVAGYSGAIANVVQGELNVSDSYILIKSVSGSPKGDGFISGGEADSKNVIVSNVKVADATGVYADPYTGFVNKAGVTLGVDGEAAVNGEDYFVNVGDLLYLNLDEIEDEVYKELLAKAVEEVRKTLVMVNQENFASVLQSQGNGYYMLEEDIDLTDVTWNAGAALTGTLNGQGHTVSNFNGDALFSGFSGTVKNIKFINASYTSNGLLSTASISAKVTIENSLFDMNLSTGARSSLLGYQVGGVATLTNVDIVMPETTSGYVGLITSHAITGLVLDNVTMVGGSGTIHSTTGNHSTLILKDDSITGTYTIFSVDEFIDVCMGSEPSEDYVQILKDTELATAITNDNVDLLQTATSGYYYLTEDIDMAGKTWAPTQGKNNSFTATLNGRGFAIKNFTAPAGHAGLVGWTGNNATFKNLTLHALTNTTRGTLIGQVHGKTTVKNCTFEIENFEPYLGGVITSVVQGDLVVDSVNVNIMALKAYNATRAGFLCGGEASSHNVTVSNVFVIEPSGYVVTTYGGDNEDKVAIKETSIGVDGELAVEGEDYIVVRDILDYDVDSIENEATKAFAKKAQEKALENATVLTKANITELLTATNGYYVLGEDIDMTDVCAVDGGWAPKQASATSFCGILNGMGHKLYNFTPNGVSYVGLFNFCGGANSPAIVKNITIEMTVAPARAGVFGRSVSKGVELRNSTVIVETDTAYNSSAIVNVAQAPVNVIDTVVVYKSRNNLNTPAYVGSTEANTASGVITLDNFVVFDLTGANLPITLSAGGVVGTEGVDYVILDDFYNIDLEKIADDDLKAFVEEKAEGFKSLVTEVTADNFEEFAQATSGYFVLTEDIDLAGKEIAFSESLAVLNGNGKVIKNATFKVAAFTSNWGAMFNNVIGETTFENVIFDVADLKTVSNTTSAAIALGVSGNLNLKNCVISVNKSNFATNNVAGIVAGCLAVGGTLTFDNTLIINTNKQFTNIVGVVKGTGAAIAVEGTYEMQSDVFDINVNALPDGMIKNFVNALIAKAEENVTVITNENVELLQTATTGYYVLGEDIDMAGKTWTPTQTASGKYFTATLNGRGFTIKNFTASAGYLGLVAYTGVGATFKNIKFHIVTNTTKGAIIGQVKGATVVENCVVDVDTLKENHAGGIADVIQGPLAVNNVLVNIDVSTHTYGVGFVAGREAATSNVTVSNCFFVSGDGKLTNVYAGDNEDQAALKETTIGTDGKLAVAGEDYVVATKLSDIDRAKLTTDLLKSGYDALIG